VNVVLWIVAGVLAAVFLGSGLLKLTQSKEKLVANPNLGWAQDFSPGVIKFIGAAEALAALGLILPAALDIAPVLVPLAATGLALVMIGAAYVHLRRKENQAVGLTVVLLALAAFLAVCRFGPYSF
jgi:uncharacterized membrane protein YphA (DoxX/SURF4 family)